MVALTDLTVRVTPEGADRCVLCGASRMGKSTAAGVLIEEFYKQYVRSVRKNAKPRGRILVVDTKPRWRPEMLADGTKAGRKYQDFLPGTVIPHSRLVSKSTDWDLAWQTGDGVVILQNDRMQHEDLIRWCVQMMNRFYKTQRHKVPSLLVIDEGMDFFGPSGTGRYGDIVQRCVRAGGEKGMASLILVQRPKTINLQVITESNYLMLFPIRYKEDLKRLWEMGIPRSFSFPEDSNGEPRKHHFALWRDGKVITHDAVFAMSETKLGRVGAGT